MFTRSIFLACLCSVVAVSNVFGQTLTGSYDGGPIVRVVPGSPFPPPAYGNQEEEIPQGSTAYEAALINARNQERRERIAAMQQERERNERERLERMPLHQRVIEQQNDDVKRFLAPQYLHAGALGKSDYVVLSPEFNAIRAKDQSIVLTLANVFRDFMHETAGKSHFSHQLGSGWTFDAGLSQTADGWTPSRSAGINIGCGAWIGPSFGLIGFGPGFLGPSLISAGCGLSYGYGIGYGGGFFLGLTPPNGDAANINIVPPQTSNESPAKVAPTPPTGKLDEKCVIVGADGVQCFIPCIQN